MRALLFCRASADSSLEAQETALVKEAERRGFSYTVVHDGGTEISDRLAETLELLDEHRADVLMAVHLDWIVDSSSELPGLVDRGKRKGWGLILSGDNLDTTAGGDFGPHLAAIAASADRDLISRRTREAMQQRKADGTVFGRKVDSGFLATYREVLAMSDRGMSFHAIARSLNDEGVPTSKGGAWYPSTVKAMVESETAKRLKTG